MTCICRWIGILFCNSTFIFKDFAQNLILMKKYSWPFPKAVPKVSPPKFYTYNKVLRILFPLHFLCIRRSRSQSVRVSPLYVSSNLWIFKEMLTDIHYIHTQQSKNANFLTKFVCVFHKNIHHTFSFKNETLTHKYMLSYEKNFNCQIIVLTILTQ